MSQRRKNTGSGPLERAPSVELPSLPPPTAKEQATSLWQRCLLVRERLGRVPGFREEYLEPALTIPADPISSSAASTSTNVVSEPFTNIPNDPVSQVTSCLRLGSSLCFLFNALGTGKVLTVNPDASRANLKVCQKGAAHFIMACSKDLGWKNEDLFTITQLYEQDTNGTVKVIHTVEKLLDELETRGVLLEPTSSEMDSQDLKPKDERSQVVKELLVTEREYVRDLEKLQDYQLKLAQNDIISQDTIHNLFMNLNTLVDFQRRFLIGIEFQASQPPEEQRFGFLFQQMEDHFSCYEPFCANFTAAQDLAIAENANLMKLSHVLDPNYALPALLIKPVQRICKYPLLLQQLLKSDIKSLYREELSAGLDAVKRVTDKVNETKRQKENDIALAELSRRVEDWKGHQVSTFGALLLEDTFIILKSMSERDYHVYLFERIILCCKEMGTAPGKKGSKSNSILKRPPQRKRTVLQLKGRIFANNVLAADSVVRNGLYLLQVTWKGDMGDEDFSLKCRSEEQLRQWHRAIRKVMEHNDLARRSGHVQNGIPRINSPMSQFPNTPASEIGSTVSGLSTGREYSYQPDLSYPQSQAGVYSGYGPSPGTFDDDVEDVMVEYEGGRSTPSVGRTARHHVSSGRPRGPIEEGNTEAINQWRSQTPSAYSSVPTTSNYSEGAVPIGYQSGSSQHSLRSSASSRNLRHKQSHEWGNPLAAQARSGEETVQPPPLPGPSLPPQPKLPTLSRQGSQASLPHHPNLASPSSPPPLRNRSASSPNIHQVQNLRHPYGADSPNVPDVPPLHMSYKQNTSSTTFTSASSHEKRDSSSSGLTHHSSEDSNASGMQMTPATSPSNAPAAALPLCHAYPNADKVAIKVKVNFGEDTFIIAVLSSVTYRELVDKVWKKLSICGDRSRLDPASIRLRYQDEEGDKILLASDDDVVMAFEWSRSQSNGNSLTLFVS